MTGSGPPQGDPGENAGLFGPPAEGPAPLAKPTQPTAPTGPSRVCAACGMAIGERVRFCRNCGAEAPPITAAPSPDSAAATPDEALVGIHPNHGGEPSPHFCANCAAPLPVGAHFCPDCATAVGAAISPALLHTSNRDDGDHKRRALVPALIVCLLVVAAVSIVALLAFGARSDSHRTTRKAAAAAPKTTRATTTTQPTTTTIDPAVVRANEEYRALVERIENILQQSSNGRREVVAVVEGVRSCTISPEDAAKRIDSVITNRSSILAQLSSMTLTGNAEANNLVSMLQQSMQYSVESNRHYRDWMTYLYNWYYYTYPVGCPNGRAPTNGDYQQATAVSGQATQAKQAFVAAFNPVAQRFGVQQWSDADF